MTVAEIGIGSSALGGVFSAFGAGKQAQGQANMLNYQASVAQLKSEIDKQNAAFARQQGELMAQQEGMKRADVMGTVKDTLAAHGLDIKSGSAAAVQQSVSQITRMDLNQIRSNAAKTAYGYTVESAFDTAQAGLFKMGARDAEAAMPFDIASSVLGTVGSVSDKWMRAQQSGMDLGIFSGNP